MRRVTVLTIVLAVLAGIAGSGVAQAIGRIPQRTVRPMPHPVASRQVVRERSVLAGRALQFSITPGGGVPRSGVAQVRLHLQLRATAPTSVTVWAADTQRPAAPTVAIQPGQRTVDLDVTPAADGMVRLVSNRNVILAGTVIGVDPIELDPRGVDWSQFDLTPLQSKDAQTARQILVNANSYAVTAWWPDEGIQLLKELTPPIDMADDPVRQLAMEAYSLAASLGTGVFAVNGQPNNPARGAVRAPRLQMQPMAQAMVRTMVTRLVASHLTQTPGGWGGTWQSSLWASLIERAAMMQWGLLNNDVRQQVAQMAAYEADYILAQPVRYFRDATGNVLTPGDTGAEEDAWFALAPATAAAMLPDDPRRAAWEHKAAELMIAAWARPSDVSSNSILDGAPLAAWLNGSNVDENGTLINHHRIAPDYMTTIYENLDTVLTDSLLGIPAPEATQDLLSPVYQSLSGTLYGAPPFNAPGGSTYTRDSSRIYYPQGCDWGTGQEAPYALVDAEASAFQLGPNAAIPVTQMEQKHLDAQLAMQQRFRDGHTYANSREYDYVGREPHVAQLAAQTYLTLFVRDRHLVQWSDQDLWSSSYAAEYDKTATRSVVPALAERRLMTP